MSEGRASAGSSVGPAQSRFEEIVRPVELNRAVAVGMASGPAAGLALAIDRIHVLETINEGASIYRREE